MPLGKFDLGQFFQADVDEIIKARANSIAIHSTTDIRTAGDEIEETVRSVLQRRLPSICHVGQGHFVSMENLASRQLDIIITDARTNSVLFRAKNGAEYLPFGSAYAFGEIKSTYKRSQHYIKKFVDTLTEINTDPPILNLEEVGMILPTPLTFMFFVDSGDFELKQIQKLYADTPDHLLPHLVYFMDKGIIYDTDYPLNSDTGERYHNINAISSNAERLIRGKHHWIFRQFGKEDTRAAANYAFFFSAISIHLNQPPVPSYNIAQLSNHLLAWEEPGANNIEIIR